MEDDYFKKRGIDESKYPLTYKEFEEEVSRLFIYSYGFREPEGKRKFIEEIKETDDPLLKDFLKELYYGACGDYDNGNEHSFESHHIALNNLELMY